MEIITVTNRKQLDECLSIRFAVFVHEQNVPADEEVDAFDAEHDACRHYLIRIDGKPVATGRWRPYEEGAAKLQRIAVLSDFRGHGLGKAVIEALERDAKAANAKAAVLDAQCQAESFYRKLGYETVSETPFLDAGIWHVRMKKDL
ncbi:GNAT family N-acetyltransferase [Paenibacillus sp. MBLB4367]|uniref:GNAT family N-acetyltransferase n=1 Tax=Paenibacillus sp. MBLB4367 TaxID=3384767 RepID=UPI0039080734